MTAETDVAAMSQLLSNLASVTTLNPAQLDVLAHLRGEPNDRPPVDPTLRGRLQAALDESLGHLDVRKLFVDKRKISLVHQCEGRYAAVDDFAWRPASAKGTLAHKAFELSVGGTKAVTPVALAELAMERICEGPETRSLADYIHELGDAERAELRVATIDLIVKFLEMFPPLKDHWIPNAEATTAAWLGNKNILVRGKIDLKLGAVNRIRSDSVIIDFKTGSPSFSDLDDLRLYALIETLRIGVPPFRWTNAYLEAGRMESEDYNEEVLWAAARRLSDAVEKIAKLDSGILPELTPGTACRFCPSQTTCESAITDLR